MWLGTEATATAGADADEDQERRSSGSRRRCEHAGDESDRRADRKEQEDV